MKRTLFFISLLLLSITAFAKPITRQMAETIASKNLKTLRHANVAVSEVNLSDEIKGRDGSINLTAPAFYTFNAEDGEGFVIVAGDDLFPEIFAYSADGCVSPDGESIPCCLKAFLENYSMYVEAVREGKAEAPQRARRQNIGTPVVDALTSAKWDQGSPYNAQCPSNSSLGQSVVGCVATAIAQILYKWKWPETGRGDIEYVTKYGSLHVDFAQSTYNWSVMKNTYSALDIKKESGKAVAKLSYDCGVSVQMKYGEDASGTHTEYALKSLYKNFKYRASTLSYMHRDCCNNLNEFYNTIIREFNAGRPVLMSAVATSGEGRDSGGHAFVIDGYDTENFIRVNWGWGGYSNGWYDLSVMDGGGYMFNSDQTIIYGIMPDYDNNDYQNAKQYRPIIQGKPRATVNSIGVNQEFEVKLDTLFNMFPFANTYYLGVGLYDYNGQLLKVISTSTHREYLPAWKGWYSYPEKLTCKVPTGYTGGYFIRFISRLDGYDDWTLPDMEGGSDLNVLPVLIQNGTVYFNQFPTAIDDINNDEDAVATEYFTVGGQKLRNIQEAHGIVIVRKQFLDGSTKTVKKIIR